MKIPFMFRKRQKGSLPALIVAIVLLQVFPGSLSLQGVTPARAGIPGCYDLRSPFVNSLHILQDTSDAIYIRIYRDSVKSAEGAYLPVEARVVKEQIISVFVGGQEVIPDDYEMYVPALEDILKQERELKKELSNIEAEIKSLQNEKDSLEKVPFTVDSLIFYPREDLQEQVMAVVTGRAEETAPPEDTLPQIPLPPDGDRINELMDKVTQLKAQRDGLTGQISNEIRTLEARSSEIMDRLNVLADNFTLEKRTPADQQEKKKKKWFGKKRKKKR